MLTTGRSQRLALETMERTSKAPPIGEVRARYRQQALEQHVSPRDVDLLLADELGRPLTFLIAHHQQPLEPASLERFVQRLQRRFAGEPLQYIRGRCEFYGREFLVDPRVFIPRPETEFVVEAAIDHLPRGGSAIDVGTGSGCIALTLACERPDLRVAAVDVSVAALAVASANRQRLGARVSLLGSSLMESVRATFDAVISNPPYVPDEEFEHLQREVRLHEPRLALTTGPQGLEVIEQLLRDVAGYLRGGGVLIMEIGFRQVESVSTLAERYGWKIVETRDDLAAIPRVVVLSR
jgi:release factor glutamine methyltransferase